MTDHSERVTPFLLAVARFHATGSVEGLAEPPGPDWPVRVAAAGMIGLAVSALRGAGLEVPAEANRLALHDVALHLRTLADLAEAAAALEAADVRWLVLKGPVLTELAYRVPGVRRYGDLDLLVHPADFDRGLDALCNGPAELIDRNWSMIDDLDRGEMVLMLQHGTVLDLHWHVNNRPATRRETAFDVLALFDHLQWITLRGRQFPTYDDVDRLVHVAVHAAQSGGHQVRWLLDVQQCAARVAHLDPGVVATRAHELGGALCLRVMLERVARHLDPALAELAGSIDASVLWSSLCRTVDRATELDVDAGRYSGRVVYSATRRDLRQSTKALRRNASTALRLGRRRRTTEVDRTLLQSPGGTDADRQAWLGRITAYGTGG